MANPRNFANIFVEIKRAYEFHRGPASKEKEEYYARVDRILPPYALDEKIPRQDRVRVLTIYAYILEDKKEYRKELTQWKIILGMNPYNWEARISLITMARILGEYDEMYKYINAFSNYLKKSSFDKKPTPRQLAQFYHIQSIFWGSEQSSGQGGPNLTESTKLAKLATDIDGTYAASWSQLGKFQRDNFNIEKSSELYARARGLDEKRWNSNHPALRLAVPAHPDLTVATAPAAPVHKHKKSDVHLGKGEERKSTAKENATPSSGIRTIPVARKRFKVAPEVELLNSHNDFAYLKNFGGKDDPSEEIFADVPQDEKIEKVKRKPVASHSTSTMTRLIVDAPRRDRPAMILCTRIRELTNTRPFLWAKSALSAGYTAFSNADAKISECKAAFFDAICCKVRYKDRELERRQQLVRTLRKASP